MAASVVPGRGGGGDGGGPGAVSEPGSRLQVTVLRARQLQGVGVPATGGCVEPYVVCQIAGKPASRCETSRSSEAVDPEFDEAFELPNYSRGDALEVSIVGGSTIGSRTTLLAASELAGEAFDRPGGYEGPLRVGAVEPESASDSEAEAAAAVGGLPPAPPPGCEALAEAAEVDVRVVVLPPEVPEELETSSSLASAPGHEPRGCLEALGPGPAAMYVAEPPRGCLEGAEGARPTDCVVIAHDRAGLESGRHRQLADALALQGWLVVIPDFASKSPSPSPTPRAWCEAIESSCAGRLLPWLERRGVEAVAVLGLGLGCIACAHAAGAQEGHLRGGSKIPRFVGSALAYPAFAKPYILNDGELQKMVSLMAGPLLVLPARGSPREIQPGGLLSLQCDLLGRAVDFVSFDRVPRGFLTDGDLASDEVSSATAWAVEVCCAFLHRSFQASEATPWREELRRPPEVEEEVLDA